MFIFEPYYSYPKCTYSESQLRAFIFDQENNSFDHQSFDMTEIEDLYRWGLFSLDVEGKNDDAKILFEKAAYYGYRPAILRSVEYGPSKQGLSLLSYAASSFSSEDLFNYGKMYIRGTYHKEKNSALGMYYLKLATHYGSEKARTMLRSCLITHL